MIDGDQSIKLAERRVTREQRLGMLWFGLILLTFAVLAAELIGYNVPGSLLIWVLAPLVSILLYARSIRTRNNRQFNAVKAYVSSAEELVEEAIELAENSEFQAAKDQCDTAADFLNEAERYRDNIHDETDKEAAKTSIDAARTDIRNCRQKIDALQARVELTEPVGKIQDQYKAAKSELDAGHIDTVVERLEKVETIEAEIESTLISLADLPNDDADTPQMRIEKARGGFLDAVSAQINQIINKHDVGTDYLNVGQYERAIKAFREAESKLESLSRVLETGDLTYNDPVVKELIEESDELRILPGVGEQMAERLTAEGFDDLEAINAASQAELKDVKGIGEKRADQLKQHIVQFSVSKVIDNRLASIESDRKQALDGYAGSLREPIESDLGMIETHLTKGEIREAERTLSFVESKLDKIVDDFEKVAQSEPPKRILSLRDRFTDSRDSIERTIEAKESLTTIDELLAVIRDDIEQERWDTASSKLTDAQERYQSLLEAEPYPPKHELDERMDQIRYLRESVEREQFNVREQITADIQEVAAELGRMPKRDEFLDRSKWSQPDFQTSFKSWNDALKAASIDIGNELLAEIERVAQSVDGKPSSLDMNQKGAYNSGMYSTYFGSWAEAVKAADIDTGTDADSDTETDTDQSPKPADDLSSSLNNYETLGDIPVDSRYHGNVAVEVVETHRSDSKKDARLTVRDATGETATFNVWSKHDCQHDWITSEWYVLSEIRLKEWERDGEAIYNLSSSRDMSIEPLANPQKNTAESPGALQSISASDPSDHENVPSDGDSVLGSIITEFDDEFME